MPPTDAVATPAEQTDGGHARRVVTGTDASGKAVVLSDGPAPVPVANERGSRVVQLWSTAGTPPDLGGEDLTLGPYSLEPPPGGAHFRVVVWPPDASRGRTHRTDTLDVLVIVSGAITLWVGEEDAAQEVQLGAGDCVVALGNVHSWQNRGPEPCVAVASMLSALAVEGGASA